jgi:fructoselysine-6-P-deglycase FrlB-like protein
MIVDPTAHEYDELRIVEHHLLVLLMATEAEDEDVETCAINTLVGQALRLVRSAASKIDAKIPKPDPIDFSVPIDRMVPRNAG